MRKKTLALLLVLVMLLGLAAPSAMAAEQEDPALTAEESVQEQEEVAVTETVDTSDIALADNDELFAGYVNQLLYPSRGGVSLLANWGSSAGVLNANERDIYNQLKGEIEDVAANGGSTVFQLTAPNITWNTTASGEELKTEAAQKFGSAVSTRDILNCLLVDCPYELYWYDKTNTGGTGWSYGIRAGSGVAMITSLTATLYVAQDYQGGNNTTVNASKVTAAKTAAGNAQAIVSKYAGLSDYEKLKGYKDEICELVSYNKNAADNASTPYGDPWQIIYVFDDNPSTNVVCEGYAKAFQYLCDLSGLTCYTVSGQMKGGTGAGDHMWNIVTLDGKNYLVDVTNSDSGSVGQNGGLFLSAPQSGEWNSQYNFQVGNSTVSFAYDSDIQSLYGSRILSLATSSYTPPAEVTRLTATATYNGTTDDSLTIDVPTKGNTVEVTLTAEATYDNGSTGKVDAEWEFFNGSYYGVSLSDNTLTITPAAGSYVPIYISASYGGQTSNVYIYLKKEAPHAGSIEISGPASVTIPTSGSTEAGYTATMENQYGEGYYGQVTWEISGPNGVSVKTRGDTTEYAWVTVPAGIQPSEAILTATCGDKSETFKIDLISKPDAGVTITNAPAEVIYNGGSQTFSLTATNKKNTGIDPDFDWTWDWSTSDPQVLLPGGSSSDVTESVTYITVKGPGKATITATYEDDTYYGQAEVTITVLKQPALSNFTYTLPSDIVYNGAEHAVDVAVKSGITGMGGYTVLYNGSETAPVNAGTYDVTLRVEKGELYTAATLDLGTLTIAKAKPAITVSDSLTIVKGTAQSLNAAISNNGALTYKSSNTRVATVDENGNVTGVKEGTATITISYAGDSNYNRASATVTVTVTDKKLVDVTFTAKGDQTYNPSGYKLGAQFSEATVDGDKSITKYIYNGTEYATLDALNAVTVTDAGTYTVTAVYESDTEYGSKDAAFTITKAEPVITVSDSLTMVKGTDKALGAVITPAGLPLQYSSSNPGAATVDENGNVTAKAVGTAVITISYAGDSNHEPASEEVQVKVIEKIPVEVTFAAKGDQTYVPEGYALGEQFSEATTTATGGGTITYTYGEKEYTSLDALPTVKDAGTYTVTAVYESETEYGEATATFTITKADQAPLTITSTGPATFGADYTLTASGGSCTGEVTFTVAEGTGKATISGGTLTPVLAGTVTVTATKAGDDNYNPVTSDAVTITIDKAAAPAEKTTVVSVKYTNTALQTVDLTGFLPADCGGIGAISVAKTDASGLIASADTSGSAVTFQLASGLSGDGLPKTAELTATVTTANYADCKVIITVTVTEKDIPTLTAQPLTVTYTGSDVSVDAVRKTATFNGADVAGTWSWASTAPKNAGTATYTLKFTPSDALNYAEGTVSVTVTVNKATPAGSPGYTAINTSGKTLKDVGLNTGSFQVDGAIRWEDDEDTVVLANTSYKWTFTPKDTDNYEVVTGSLTPYRVSTGGDSSPAVGSPISAPSASNGSVRVSPGRAEKGDTVTITAIPDKGFVLESIVVTDRSGNSIRLTNEGDGIFTFTMPSTAITVKTVFVPEGTATPVSGDMDFADVGESHWAYNEISWAYENGYMNGISATTFSPSGTVSRQQVWMILARMAGANPANMAEAKAWSVANGISDGSNPGGAVTRQQLVALLYRFAAQYGYDTTAKADLSGYPDAASLASYATDAMAWSVANGIIGGTTQGTLNPTGTANRGQFAAILWRFYQTTAI